MLNDLKSRDNIDEAFGIFWCAGLRKINKKECKKIFSRIVKGMDDPIEFANKLNIDISTRLDRKQFGFDALHPKTYLNGERWEDELPSQEVVKSSSTKDMTLEDHFDRSWAQ
jgi:hypothetical protein